MSRGSSAVARVAVAIAVGGLAMIMLASPASAGHPVDCVDHQCWSFSPSAGPAGTFVQFHGRLPRYITAGEIRHRLYHPLYGFDSVNGYPAGAYYPHGCPGFHPDVERFRWHVDRATRTISGSFRMGTTGFCAYQDIPQRDANVTAPVLPGRYTFAFNCVVCVEGVFRITGPSRLAF